MVETEETSTSTRGADMDPTEGLPVAIERPAILRATRVVVEDRLGELGFGLAFEIMQVEQVLAFRLLGAGALGVNGFVGGDDLSAGYHGPGLDDGEWSDLRAVLDRRGLEQQAVVLDRVPEHQRLMLQHHVVTDRPSDRTRIRATRRRCRCSSPRARPCPRQRRLRNCVPCSCIRKAASASMISVSSKSHRV